MKILRLVALAASAASTPAVMAQTVSDPDPFYGIPAMTLSLAAAAPAAAPMPAAPHPGAVPAMRHNAGSARMMQGPVRGVVRHQMHRMGPGMMPGMPHHGGRFGHIRRINRGAFIPHFWFGPQFMVRNWGMYGFPQPFDGGRWVRYYDDALLVDRDGRVRDGRYGMDWDRYGERWGEDERGIPAYVGDGDYEPGEWDYDWAEGYENGEYRDEHHADRGGPPPCGNRCGPPPPPCGNPCGGGYGYGWGWTWGPISVTETTVTPPPVVEMRTYYEYVTERARPAPRRVHRRVIHRAPPPPPPPPRPRPGERG